MARRNEVPPEQTKSEIKEPTLESRVSGVEYRLSHPNRPSLDTILDDIDNSIRFRKEFDRCRLEGRVATARSGDNMAVVGDAFVKALEAETAGEARYAHDAPIARQIIWGALLGAALALAVLALCNPAAFHRPKPVAATIVLGSPLSACNASNSLDESGRAASQGDQPLAVERDVRTVSLQWFDDYSCWKSVKSSSGKTLFEGSLSVFSVKAADMPVTVRTGCPGAGHYFVDGVELRPPNLSKTPDKSEVVVLP